ncbi:MAG: acetyltransferase [Armatimonadota bacterium]
MRELYIIGAGGHGAVISEIAQLSGYKIAAFIDDNPSKWGTRVLDHNVIGGIESIPDNALVTIGIGDNKIRDKILDKAVQKGWSLPVLTHPGAIISPSAVIAPGTVVMAQAVVNARSSIGKACILNTSCSVDHDCIIEDTVHIAPGTHLSGGIKIGKGTLLGVGSCVKPEIEIGRWCIIGAGSVVVSNIPGGMTVFGNPAHINP